MSQYYRRRKLNLYAKDPHCFWCGRKTILTKSGEGGKIGPSAATVDHLISRFHPERFKRIEHGQLWTVLACYECNQRRAVEEEKTIPKEILLLRSRGFSLKPNNRKSF